MSLTITLDGSSLECQVPTTKKKRRAYVKSIVPATLLFVVLTFVAHAVIWAAKEAGWEGGVINSSYINGVLFVSGILLSILTASAHQRFQEDHAAAGEVNNGFRHLSGMCVKSQISDLKMLAWLMFYFYRAESANARNVKGDVFELSHLLTWFKESVDGSGAGESAKYFGIQAVIEIDNALGGIRRRRTYGILKSRYVVNMLLAYGSVFVWLVVVASGEKTPVLGYSLALLFTYVYSTIFIYIKRMENGIGYDIGDIDPDESLRGWLRMIEEASRYPFHQESSSDGVITP